MIKEALAANIDTAANGIATIKGFEGLFENIVTVVLALAGIAFFIAFVVGGFKFMTGSDPKSLDSAKNTLTYAIAGLVIVAISYLILVVIANFTGVQGILNFKVGV